MSRLTWLVVGALVVLHAMYPTGEVTTLPPRPTVHVYVVAP